MEIWNKKRKRKIWFEVNEDAKGYPIGDNRAIEGTQNDRREVNRRTWNF